MLIVLDIKINILANQLTIHTILVKRIKHKMGKVGVILVHVLVLKRILVNLNPITESGVIHLKSLSVTSDGTIVVLSASVTEHNMHSLTVFGIIIELDYISRTLVGNDKLRHTILILDKLDETLVYRTV